MRCEVKAQEKSAVSVPLLSKEKYREIAKRLKEKLKEKETNNLLRLK